MTKFSVGQKVVLNGRVYEVCSLTSHEHVYALAIPQGYFHAHASVLKAA
jgi:hypothetical protein